MLFAWNSYWDKMRLLYPDNEKWSPAKKTTFGVIFYKLRYLDHNLADSPFAEVKIYGDNVEGYEKDWPMLLEVEQ